MSKNAIATGQGKKSYCLHCKAFTETVLYRASGPLPFYPRFLSSIVRICQTCAKPKTRTEIETDEPIREEWTPKKRRGL